MPDSFNVYLDESCHLENDSADVMMLGAVWCAQAKARDIGIRIRDIQKQHGLSEDFEIKWTKVSPAKVDFYQAVLDYFLDDDDLHFRGVVIPNKTKLDHAKHAQSHDDWYYKMCFTLLEPIRCRRDPSYDGKHYGFWHCISDGKVEEDRTPDMRRCERISWIRPIIQNASSRDDIDIWKNQRGRDTNVLVWYDEYLLVVLTERTRKRDGFQYFHLKTAYTTTEEHRIRKLRRERDEYEP